MIKGIEKSCLKMVQGRQEVLTGDPDGLTWDEFERMVMTWAQPKYGASYARGLWCNQLPDISWLDLKVEEDFNTFKVECKKVYEIIAHENEPYAKVLYSREWFWSKKWQEDYRRDQRQKLCDYLTTICHKKPLQLLEEEGKKWSESAGGLRYELYSRYGRVDPKVLENRVVNYCLGMPGVDGVTPWPPEVNLVDKLVKLEQERLYLIRFSNDVTEDYDEELTEEKLVEIVIDYVPDWCQEAVDLARLTTMEAVSYTHLTLPTTD